MGIGSIWEAAFFQQRCVPLAPPVGSDGESELPALDVSKAASADRLAVLLASGAAEASPLGRKKDVIIVSRRTSWRAKSPKKIGGCDHRHLVRFLLVFFGFCGSAGL